MLRKLFVTLCVCSSLLPAASYAAKGTFGIGIEGFRDTYKEPTLDLKTETDFGSITGYYSQQMPRYFYAIDGRASYGTDDYESPSGKLSGVPQWEFELRGRFGLNRPLWGGTLAPYTGLGMRYYRDEGKGYATDTGALAYDRRIFQAYIPIGATLSYVTEDGWHITPGIEGDLMFYGNVNSRLTNLGTVFVPGVGLGEFKDPAYNRQKFGYGGRAELMVGKSQGSYSWQVGPFIRYWHVQKSDGKTYVDSSGTPVIDVFEPKNDRTQIGVAARILW